MSETNITDLDKELEKAKQEAYAIEKAKQETNALMNIANDTSKTLQVKLNQKLANHIETDGKVAERLEETANKLVEKGLQAQDNQATASVMASEDAVMEEDFKKNCKEYKYHGIDHKIDKQWKRTAIMVVNDIWFVIWLIVGAFTFVGISTFLDRIRVLSGFVKWVAVCLGIVLGLASLTGLTYLVLNLTGVING